MTTTDDHETLCRIAVEIFNATHVATPDAELITAPELARILNMKLDKLKKKLRPLVRSRIVQSLECSPKRYRFDLYTFHKIGYENVFYESLTSEDSPYKITDATS